MRVSHVMFMMVFGVLSLAAAVSCLANPPCGQCICYPDCTICPGQQTYYVEYGGCENGEQEFRCVWSCGHHSQWDKCWCDECKCNFGGGGGCFLAGTPILIADGSTKPIETIHPGDQVLAYDKMTAAMRQAEITVPLQSHTADSYLVINGTIRVTPTQPMLSGGKWINAGDLRVGDSLTAAGGGAVPIETIWRHDEQVAVYNFQVGALGSYVAQGVIVHNKEFYTYYPCLGCE
jgi:hypothetical protein